VFSKTHIAAECAIFMLTTVCTDVNTTKETKAIDRRYSFGGGRSGGASKETALAPFSSDMSLRLQIFLRLLEQFYPIVGECKFNLC